MDEITRFADPYDTVGLRAWKTPGRSRLLRRLKALTPRPTVPGRRGYYLLRDLLGDGVEELPSLEMEYCYQRLLLLDWTTEFRELGFFTEEEIRAHAVLYGPPTDSAIGHYWYGLLGREDRREIDRILRRKVSFPYP